MQKDKVPIWTKEILKIPNAPLPDWKRHDNGGEAIIYTLPDSTVAKILRHWDDPYFQNNPNPEQADAIKNKFWEYQWKLPAIPDMPAGVVAPIKLIATEQGSIIGYVMKRIENVLTFDQLWNKIQLKEKMLALRKAYELIAALHAIDVIGGDLIPRDFGWNQHTQEVVLFDADGMSYSGFPCRTFSLGYVDRDLLDFNVNRNNDILTILGRPYEKISDWVAFHAISLNVMVGIDPYEGTHPKHTTKESRVMENVTMFSGEVQYPVSAPPVKTIPRPLLESIFLTFKHNQRSIPSIDILST